MATQRAKLSAVQVPDDLASAHVPLAGRNLPVEPISQERSEATLGPDMTRSFDPPAVFGGTQGGGKTTAAAAALGITPKALREKLVTYTMRLSPSQIQELEDRGKKAGISASELSRALITQGLALLRESA